jgi:hypothetical protein
MAADALVAAELLEPIQLQDDPSFAQAVGIGRRGK